MLRIFVALVGIALCSLVHAEGASPEEGANDAAFLARLEQIQVEIKNRLGETLARHQAGQPLPDWQALVSDLEMVLRHLQLEAIESGWQDDLEVGWRLIDLRGWTELLGKSQELSEDQLRPLVASALPVGASPFTAGQMRWLRVGDAMVAGVAEPELPKGAFGVIEGRVVDAVSGEPLDRIRVSASPNSTLSYGFLVGADGRYRFELPPGSYRVSTEGGEDHLGEVFPDIPCTAAGCDFGSATLFEVENGSVHKGVDFTLDFGGAIRGQVTRTADSTPIRGVALRLRDPTGKTLDITSPDSQGRYRFGGLYSGTYYVNTSSSTERDEIWNDQPCFGECDLTQATGINVVQGNETTGIDFALGSLGVISGRVVDVEGLPVGVAVVTAYSTRGIVYSRFTSVNSEGDYQLGGLETGAYTVQAWSLFDEHTRQAYDGIECPTPCDTAVGDLVAAQEGAITTGIDFRLEREGSISGVVSDRQTGELLGGTVYVENEQGFKRTSGFSGGTYRVVGLAPGEYQVVVEVDGYLQQTWDDVPCPRGLCEFGIGATVSVAPREQVTAIGFALDRGSRILGRFIDSKTGNGIPGFGRVYDLSGRERGNFTAVAQGTAVGTWRTHTLPAGTYFVTAAGIGYQPQVYEHLLCPAEGCQPTLGTPIELVSEEDTVGVDIELSRLSSISGRIVDADSGEGLRASLRLYDAAGEQVTTLTGGSGSDGAFTINSLHSGTYFLRIGGFRYLTILYDGFPCPGGNCDPRQGTPIEVEPGSSVTDIVVALENELPLITGGVALRGTPVHALVCAYDESGNPARCVNTDSSGRYQLRLPPSGSYSLLAVHRFTLGEVYGTGVCRWNDCDPLLGTYFQLALDEVVGDIDFDLSPNSSFGGSVKDRVSGEPINRGRARLWREDGRLVEAMNLLDRGLFLAQSPLAPGRYYLTVSLSTPYQDVLWQGLPCVDGDCDPTTGTPIDIVDDEPVDLTVLVSPVDNGCGDAGGLCLTESRFRVQADWRRPDGSSGSGEAVPLSSDSGYLWFFDAANIELVVKVLDACAGRDRFWVFAAGLTNVEVTLTVTDTWTDTNKVYVNPLGQAFQPIQDTQAFGTCDAAQPRSFGGSAVETLSFDGPAISLGGNGGLELGLELEPRQAKGLCGADSTSLCLADGRFQVEAFWTRPNGESGLGQAVPLTGDTGYFWFFDSANIEAVVKVLDACSGRDRFWVFAAGLTNVEVVLRVTDTLTGEFKDYENPQGRAFQPVQDTQAFATCQ